MYFCYLDEAGCPGVLPSPTSLVQPVFVLLGLLVGEQHLSSLTRQFVDLKERFFPDRMRGLPHRMDRILEEVKGSDVRRSMRARRRKLRRQVIGFLDHVLHLLEGCGAKLIGRVWIKGIRYPMNSRSLYTAGTQAICEHFQTWLRVKKDNGFVIADARRQRQNIRVSYSIFTKKFKRTGDECERILEVPTFGNSKNHAGLQIADLICSGIVFPIACHIYCAGYIKSVHISPTYGELKDAFAGRLCRLQYRYQSQQGRWTGGLGVSDHLGERPGALLFR